MPDFFPDVPFTMTKTPANLARRIFCACLPRITTSFASATRVGSLPTSLKITTVLYIHGKFLLSDKIPKNEPVSNFLRTRLDKNRQHLMKNPQDLKPYLPAGKTARADDLLQRISLESKLFQSVMDDFEHEENFYLSNCS